MLGDPELDQTVAQLAQVRQDQAKQHQTLTEVLEKYGALVEDYRRLKSDFEEERDTRERYKQLAKGSERNPFVLVLVDGDGYIFDDNILLSKEDGGQRAAQLLDDAVKASLRQKGLYNCKVMVRIYANLAGLSKALARAKLSGSNPRSIATFVANFNRSNDLFDFVDAGELKENADFKLRSMWVENSQCKHIYFAGCHDVGYINELTPYQSSRDKITLIRTYAFHPEFNKLGMHVEDFPGVFRQTSLDQANFYSAPSPNKPAQISAQAQTSKIPSTESSDNSGTAKVCYFYQKGKCTYGQSCKNLHVKASNGNAQFATAPRTAAHPTPNDWRHTQGSSDTIFTSNPDSDSMRGASAPMPPAPTQADYRNNLPRPEQIPQGTVAVNKDGHRLDPYVDYTAQDRADFTQRVARRKLCNQLHLNGECPNPTTCQFDHFPISDGVRNYLRSVTASQPCPRRGDCRRANCLGGHLCQKGSDCQRRGGKAWCKLPEPCHGIDLAVAQYDDAIDRDQQAGREPTPTESEADGKSTSGESRSFFSMPFGHARSATQEQAVGQDSSEDEENGAERNGAELSPVDDDLD